MKRKPIWQIYGYREYVSHQALGAPKNVYTVAEFIRRHFSPDQVARVIIPFRRSTEDITRLHRLLLSASPFPTAAKAFVGFNISAILTSGGVATMAVATTMVAGAGAVGYGVGTLIDRTFNLSDRIGDGLYNFFSRN